MANTYFKIYLHLIFAVKRRYGLIHTSWQNRLYEYIGGTIRNKGCLPIRIGGIEDHIHILVALNPKVSVSDLIRDIKSTSSKLINDERLCRVKFEWQKGYACFSYSHSQIDQVAAYIDRQYEHHKKCSLRNEIIDILSKFDVDFDGEYIFSEPE